MAQYTTTFREVRLRVVQHKCFWRWTVYVWEISVWKRVAGGTAPTGKEADRDGMKVFNEQVSDRYAGGEKGS
jgi:hypothetical protein